MGRMIGGVLAGAVTAFVLIWLMQLVSHYVWAPPAIDPTDREAMREFISRMPLLGKLSIPLIYALATAVGGYVGARIGWDWRVGLGSTALVLLATIANLFMLPHPLWLAVLMLLAVALPGWAGARLGAGLALDPRVTAAPSDL
ncbi:hypothetical protein Q0812_11310 [Brevundimonas sp. 2R-24]|uniref:ABC transporter permease n=1 Tax=Peiella sedimenti TaxID=3061083 RepID=A0ABT8SPV4_9CAUL|nr:hypothetical protein [Caulobacteraceae bacterium XZ-24]